MIQKTVKASTLILACILLVGVISMALGFYNHNSLYISVGISITLLTSLTITFQNILTMNKNKRRAK